MSLYNMLFGVNQYSHILLEILGLSMNDIPRFRDCFLEGDNIVVHTRTGGGNRDYYENEETCRENYPLYFVKEEEIPTGPWNDDMRSNPFYLHDEDGDYDSTYANFYFRFPDEYAEDLKALAAKDESYKPSEKWEALFKVLGSQDA